MVSNLRWIDGRYEIVRPLGSGGSSKVYLAIDRKDIGERSVAIKVLGQTPNWEQEIQKEFFEREVHALLRLSNPQIVRLLDYGDDQDNRLLYVVLEYVEQAQSLRERYAKWQPEIREAVDFLLELLDGIGYAHESHIIHRDLNPNNVLLDGRGYAKIIDFGISKVLGTLSAGKTVKEFYTRPYASPEQINQNEVTFASDVYSLAAIFYFIITGKDPDSKSPLASQLERLFKLPPDIRQVCLRMAAEHPEERFRNARQVIPALKAAKRQVEIESQSFYVALTARVVRQLYEQGVISNQTFADAREVMKQAFGAEVYLEPVQNAANDQYDIFSDSYILNCRTVSSDQHGDHSHFLVTSIKVQKYPHKLERLKQKAFKANADWHIGFERNPIPSDISSLGNFLDEVDAFFESAAQEQKRRERRADLVDTWLKILDLDRELTERAMLNLDYQTWSLIEDGTVIEVQLAQEGNVERLFDLDQLVTMTSKKSQPLAVGRYLGQEGTRLRISRLPKLATELLAPKGRIDLDQSLWANAWRHQRAGLLTILDERCANPHLPDVLVDPTRAEFNVLQSVSQYYTPGLDETKQSIVQKTLSAKDLYLIQGPPGTGKTVVIAEIIAQILHRKPKAHILLVSQSHVAVDHAMMRVNELLGETKSSVRMVRMGRSENIGLGAEQFMLDQGLRAWSEQVSTKSASFLEANRNQTPKRQELEKQLVALGNLRDMVRNRSESEETGMTPEVFEQLSELQKQFPRQDIKPTTRSLNELEVVIQELINDEKSPVEVALEDWLHKVQSREDIEDAYLQGCSIIAGTCVGIASKRTLPDRYDWVIVDEAGRATPSEILIPLVRAEHAILVGDHKQLPPVVEHELESEISKRRDIDPFWARTSLFEYLFEKMDANSRSILQTQYRMHPAIAHLVSSVFYKEEQLDTGVEANERLHGWRRWNRPVVWYSTSQIEHRYEGRSQNASYYNLCEINLILSELTNLDRDLQDRKERKRVGIIAGYSAQVDYLRRELDAHNVKRWKAVDLEINTVDAFQGREVDFVFYSVVRSNRERRIGFLSDVHRLNVALSRARELLFIVGDHRMLFDAITGNNINPFHDVITHIKANKGECMLLEARDGSR